jgi:hypothetical protein
MAETKTQARIDWPTVMLVGAMPNVAPRYVSVLEEDGYALERVRDATSARNMMANVMPHVVVVCPSVPMTEHRYVHETASAVGAEVLFPPDDAHPEIVRVEVEVALKRAQKRREKR